MHRAFIGAFALCLWPACIAAQTRSLLEYPTKIVCGLPTRLAVAQGYYYTAINVHNQGAATLNFDYYISLTDTGQIPGTVVAGSAPTTLGPYQALEIDCNSMRRSGHLPLFMKGFATIRSRVPLDIVAVYTASAKEDGPIEVLEIERVPFRRGGITRPVGTECKAPDLIIESIARPSVFTAAGASFDSVWVRNIGVADAPASYTQLKDLTTATGGAPFQSVMATPPIPLQTSRLVLFSLPYLPHAGVTLEATADIRNQVTECHEDNNTKMYVVP